VNEDDYIIEEPEVPAGVAQPKKRAKALPRPEPIEPAAAAPTRRGGKKDAKSNPCRGKVTKQKGKAARHDSGGAAPPAKGAFDPKAIAETVGLWWEYGGGDAFVIRSENDEGKEVWAKWPLSAVRLEIRQCVLDKLGSYIAAKPRDNEVQGEIDMVLAWVRKNRMVEAVFPALAGYMAGLHELRDGKRVVVRMSPRLVSPVPGNWDNVRELVEGRLDLSRGGVADVNQSVYFHAWLQTAYRSLVTGKPGSRKPGHILGIFGPGGCGKSRLQINIITPMLGGRIADPTSFMTGEDSYNVDMMGAEHQCVEELQKPSWSAGDRVNLSESMKRIVATESKRLRMMRTDPITVDPFWRMSITMNNDPDKIRAFPMLTPDFSDKVVLLLAAKRPLPMPTRTDAEQEAFNAQIASELPAYAHWLLNEFEIPEELLQCDGQDATRFGFASYQHPTLASQLFDDTPAAHLLRLVDAAEFSELGDTHGRPRKLWELPYPQNTSGRKQRGGSHVTLDRVWEGTAEKLDELLTGNASGWSSSVGKPATRLLAKTQITTLLSRLKEDALGRVDKRDRAEARGWAIEAPEAWQPSAGEQE
jgi:hypothetical protein